MPKTLVTEGKTKKIFSTDNPGVCEVVSKDDITAGDGAKHDVISEKGALATRTTCNVFRLLKACGIPVAFIQQCLANMFTAILCKMLPYEVVVRREAYGSYLHRAPHLAKGHHFSRLVLEFFLKTSGRKWGEHDLPCDDPLMRYEPGTRKIYLYNPKDPTLAQMTAKPFLILNEDEVFTRADEAQLMELMGPIARRTFLILEKAWALQGKKLLDFKIEFGVDATNRLLVADTIDNDSWRLMDLTLGEDISKQTYRDGGNLSAVAEKYRLVAELTDRFALPKQQVILWRGSEKDDLQSFWESLTPHQSPSIEVIEVTCSVHKNPVDSLRTLQKAVSSIPDSIIIAYIGMSNGAGPTLAANTTIPVITVPASYREFREDIWSSLRCPSNVPAMTVLSPSNATLAALQILATHNPALYASLRFEQEKCIDGI